MASQISPASIECPGCGILFPPFDGPTHRYIGASAACWALKLAIDHRIQPEPELLTRSRGPALTSTAWPRIDAPPLDAVWDDAYFVQHHGGDSPQAIQSVAVHLLTLHGTVTKGADGVWIKRRALRERGVFHKLQPPPIGCSLTVLHFFPTGGIDSVVTRSNYAHSVYNAWMIPHRTTVTDWYERHVVDG